PIEGKYNHAANFYGNIPLGPHDIAASPDLVQKYGMGREMVMLDKYGNLVNTGRIGDLSYRSPGHPNRNTFEMRNMHDKGWLKLVPKEEYEKKQKDIPPINITYNIHAIDSHDVHRFFSDHAETVAHHVRRAFQDEIARSAIV